MSPLPDDCPLATWNHRDTIEDMVVLVANYTGCATLRIFPTDDSMFSGAQEDVVVRCTEAVDGMYRGRAKTLVAR